MAGQGYGLILDDIRILREMIRWWRGRGGSQRPVPTRRRTRGGGSGGDSIFCAKLILDVPERSVLEDACIVEVWTGSWYGELTEINDEDEEVPVKWAVINRTNKPFQAGLPNEPITPGDPVVYVWGRKRLKDDFVLVDELGEPILDDEDEIQYVTKPCLEVFSPNLDMTILSGYENAPDNGVGQVPVSKHGVNTTVADGGPCGVVGEP